MLTTVECYNESNGLLSLPLDGETSEFVLKSIEGLGPVVANILTTEYVEMDGGVFQSSKRGQRNIVMTIGFDPSYATDDPYGRLRRYLYAWFTPKMQVDLRFISTNFETVTIAGWVESFETVIFSQEPEVQISIICPYPHFTSITPITLPFNTPVSNVASVYVDNPGNVNVGFTLTVENYFASTMAGFTLQRTVRAPASMVFVEQLPSIEETIAIRINTVRGAKSAAYKLQSAYNPSLAFGGTNIIGYIDRWLELIPGINALFITYSATFPPVPARASLTYTPAYVGL